ncbi:MAG: B12-binding domain-containing radical SAM protein [Deltaproteobacteria bacterium]|nr:B12-binding domain-containing radical SAM protein [Deltaproteobacteria bacterium]
MKLLLLNPPIRDFYDTEIRLQPLGLAMIKAAVRKYVPQVEVIIKDYHHGHGRRTVPIPSALAYVKEFYSVPDQSPFSTFHQFYHFGAAYEDLARDVETLQPDLIGISSLFTPYYQEVLSCARAIKARWPAPIIIGGHHASAAPESLLTDPAVDFVIRGEGERPLVEFLQAHLTARPLDQVPNLGFKHQARMILNPLAENYPLNDLPMADFSDWPVSRYNQAGKPIAMIAASRGCPHGCSFCSIHQTFGRRYRRRAPDLVVAEVEERYRQGYRLVDFEDDNLTWDQGHFRTILNGISQLSRPEGLILTAMNGVSYLGLENETLLLMKKAGFTHLNLSLVSSRGRTLDRVERPHTVAEFEAVVRQARALDFNLVAYQILGLPQENLIAMIETMALLARLPVLIGASIFYLTPGCPLNEAYPDLGSEEMVRARSTAMAIETPSCRRDDLATLFITARILNFLKGLPVHGPDTDLSSALTLARGLGRRQVSGVEIMEKLFSEGRLYAKTGQGMVRRSWFKTALFFEILSRAEVLATSAGGSLKLTH